jgi:mannosyltransferase
MNIDFQKPRTIYLTLFGITVLGTALRLYHLDFQSLWYDELHSIIPTDPKNSFSSVIQYSKSDQPPVYFIYLYYFFKLFGYHEVSGRIASVVMGVLAIPVMFFLGREIKGATVGLGAALLTSLNYMHIYYSQELRFYSTVFLFTALSFLFFIRAFKDQKNVNYLLYVVCTTALLYTHYYGLIIFAVQGIIFLVLLIYRRDKTFVLKCVFSCILVIVFFLPWLPVIFTDLGITSYWIRRPEPTFFADYFYYYFGKDAFVTVVFIFLIVLFVKMLIKDKRLADRKPLYLIIALWLFFSYFIPYIKSITGTPVLYVRYTIISLPALILVISVGWDLIGQARWKYGVIIAVSLSMVINLFLVRRHYHRIDKQQFREVSALVMKVNQQSYPVYSRFAWHFNFYFKEGRMKALDLAGADLSTVDRFWLLEAEFFSPEEKTEAINSLNGQFEIVETHPFHKTGAFLMKRVR